MRQSLRQELKQTAGQQLFGTDLYDYILQHTNDARVSTEFGVIKQEIESLKLQMRRG